jgi:Asp-tRNA(Asn)/Glu-tRNA(Gln) amidotransferase A subunit family amidase
MSNTNFLTATATQAGVRDGTISLPQILKDHHKRYEQRDGDVHAWVVTRHWQLLDEAEVMQADHEKVGDDMLLRGVTVGVKDITSESWAACIADESSYSRHAHQIRLKDL